MTRAAARPGDARTTSDFEQSYSFPLDDFQRRAIAALDEGRGVLVAAPTGAGKTVVGEYGVWKALRSGGKAFYTTPLKALSNQKFGDFVARHGADRVGLLTGDNSINGDAPVVVMTTEVLRNMIYEGSPALHGLQVVVMDEVHYLKDQYRGATWEEILIQLPADVRIVALSATISNAEEFGGWLSTVRGETEIVVETHRPVPIEHHYLVGKRLFPMFVDEDGRRAANPALRRLSLPDPRARGERRGRVRVRRPDRVEVVERLRDESLLPAIVFIFSRNGCDQAVDQCIYGGLSLTDEDERERIREYVELRTATLPEQDHEVLGYARWVEALLHGFASHHAGMIPLFKETVEELFERSLVKVVFATETLALGINMPARTVVIERLIKFTGERHELLSEGDYTQLTGRAGRRGMDEVGFGVTLLQPDVPVERVLALAAGRSFPLSSSFRPSYNMAVNLLRIHSVEEATRLLNLSFAQYLADKGVVREERQIDRNQRFLEGYRKNAECERGDFAEYWRLLQEVRGAEREEVEEFRRNRARNTRTAFESLRPGQVLRLRKGRRAGLVAVLDVRYGKRGEPQPIVLTSDRRISRLAIRDFPEPPTVVGSVRLPRGDARAPRYRNDVGRQLERFTPDEESTPLAPVKKRPDREVLARLREHPVHGCPERDEHERWMLRIQELERETEALRRRVRRRTETLARMFERVLSVLEQFGYVEAGHVSEKGAELARIYNEGDLLVAEALFSGVFDQLEPHELAAVVSTLVYETRVGVPEEWFPTEAVAHAYRRLVRLYRSIHAAEEQANLELVREPDPGFAGQILHWAKGMALEEVLNLGEMSAGDFVRATKQVWDLLRQLAELDVDEHVTKRCRDAARAIYRGVVAYSGAL